MPTDPAGDGSPLALHDYLGILWRRLWIVLAVTAIVCGVGVLRSVRQTKIYQAQAQVDLTNASRGADLQTQIQVVASPAVHDLAARRAPGIGRVSTQQGGLGNIITISAEDTDPQLAARTVNATIDAYAAYVQKLADAQAASVAAPIQSRIRELGKQITALGSLPSGSALAASLADLYSQKASLQQRLDSLQYDPAAAGTGINVVARATVPTSPIRPKPRHDGLIALGAGLLLGLALAFAVEYLFRPTGKSETSDLLPQRFVGDVTLMGVIPTGGSSISDVVALSAPDSAAAQSYRSVHNAASFMGLERGRCLEVTSAPDRDGKTETLANLAVLIARTGRRVIVVDCDLRKPSVHEFFGLPNETGFTSVMRGMPLVEALQRVPNVDHLYALTSGPLPADPDDMLGSDRCADIIGSLLVGGTLVLLDAPPMLPVTDAFTLAKTAPVDGIVLVATARTDAREHLRQALDALHHSGASQVGVVLTTHDGAFGEQPVESEGPAWSRRRRHRSGPVVDAENWAGLMRGVGYTVNSFTHVTNDSPALHAEHEVVRHARASRDA